MMIKKMMSSVEGMEGIAEHKVTSLMVDIGRMMEKEYNLQQLDKKSNQKMVILYFYS